ncbi:hypothetical protein DPMN_099677 [Dreissena polymorpha]|uniref:Uncharacterized protein n=1 Tax=Dreissena polymorpha TaxID=45954 RepID=A0A9D4LEJ6_DREPO|nr:hypothetical protein DPMN_099677 [Dreissena polymorpha]
MTDIIRDLFFVDDLPLNAVSEADMQLYVGMSSSACTHFGLTILSPARAWKAFHCSQHHCTWPETKHGGPFAYLW